jgi:hypothetical protein
MRRLLFPLALLCLLLALPSSASAAYTLGVSDQQARVFSSPLFKPLKFRAARYIAPYDVMSSPADRVRLEEWMAGARRARVRVLLSLEKSRQPGRERRLPSVREYTRELRKIKAEFPWLREFSPWNEANRFQSRTRTAGQPTRGQERRLAQFYMASRRVFGKRTTYVALDVLDEQNVNKTITFIRKFLRYARPRPTVLGFHNYSDTNRNSQTRTKRVLRAWGKTMWLTETGGIVKLGRAFRFSTTRAARALGCMFDIARDNPRVKRLYVYQFHGDVATADFDAGLTDVTGTVRRPGYRVVQRKQARNCGRR